MNYLGKVKAKVSWLGKIMIVNKYSKNKRMNSFSNEDDAFDLNLPDRIQKMYL